MTAPHEARSWRLPWYLWLAGIAVCLLGLGAWWLSSDRDLLAFDAKARAAGVLPTWAEVGLTASPPARIARWNRLMQLAESVKSYQYSCDWRPRAGEANPPELVGHHNALPTSDLAELLTLCDELTPGVILRQTTISYDTNLDDLAPIRLLCRLLAERIALASDVEVACESQRLLTAAAAQQTTSLIGVLVRHSCLAIWQSAVARRLDSPGIDRERLAGDADRARLLLAADLATCLDGEVRFCRDLLQRLQNGEPKVVMEFEGYLDLPRWLHGMGLGRTWARMGRRQVLDLLLDSAVAWNGAVDFPARTKALGVVQHRIEALPEWQPAARLTQIMIPAVGLIHESWIKADTGLRIIAAELRHTAWPIDPMDPTAKPVRRIERNGRLIGYYLVGRNGVDDGGRVSGGSSSNDVCTALYERLGSQMAADPPKTDP